MASTTETPAPTTAPQAEVTLYWLEKSRSQRILWLLEELSVPYTLKTYKRGADMLAGPELKKIHPLGKSPVLGVKAAGMPAEHVIAESGAIVEYLVDHWGAGSWVPARWVPGREGTVGGETAEWLRYRYFMHYAEGSLMGLLILALTVSQIRNAPVPFFIKPVTKGVAARIESSYLSRNLDLHFTFLEAQLASSGGDYICGTQLTGADIMLVFPLEAAQGARTDFDKAKFPKIVAYTERLRARKAYQAAVQRIKDDTGKYEETL